MLPARRVRLGNQLCEWIEVQRPCDEGEHAVERLEDRHIRDGSGSKDLRLRRGIV